jgi:redox-sensing transcriptional repressor
MSTRSSAQNQNRIAPTVPDIVVARLPIYLRVLAVLQTQGKHYTSSQELAALLGIGSAQIRKDLSHFGEFGKQGTGYSVAELQHRLREILHLDREWKLIIIGAGHVGNALANYSGFAHRGFRVVGVFDNAANKIGRAIGSLWVRDIEELTQFVHDNGVHMAMIAVPAAQAQAVSDICVSAGVRAILNYAPLSLNVPAQVHVQNIDPVLHLQHMAFYL